MRGLIVPLCLMAACIAPRKRTLTDEAYAQHFSTGSANRGSNTFNSHSGGSALITAAIMAAHEWQSYSIRCQKI